MDYRLAVSHIHEQLNDPEFFAKVQAVDGMLYWDDDVDIGEDDAWDAIVEQGGFSKVKKRLA